MPLIFFEQVKRCGLHTPPVSVPVAELRKSICAARCHELEARVKLDERVLLGKVTRSDPQGE